MNIAIITARGGSKRIPRKNIKDFCGKPILCYSIDAALQSHVFDEVMVSTDDEEIAVIAKAYGAKVPFFRSEATSDDFSTTSDVLMEVLSTYKRMGALFEKLCCIYPTAPFITAEKLRAGMKLLTETSADMVMPVVQYSFPPQRAVKVQEGRVTMVNSEYLRTRSQDLEPIYHDCGQFYCINTESLFRYKNIITDNTSAIIFPESEVQDIDSLEDWKLAELKYMMMSNK